MKYIALILVLSGVIVFGSSLGVLAGTEINGRNRTFVGAKVTLGDNLSLGAEILYPVSALSNTAEELSQIDMLEIDILLLLRIPLKNLGVYAGVGPIIIYDFESSSFNLYSQSDLRIKAGVEIPLGALLLFIDGNTILTYSPSFMISGVYSIAGGIALKF